MIKNQPPLISLNQLFQWNKKKSMQNLKNKIIRNKTLNIIQLINIYESKVNKDPEFI